MATLTYINLANSDASVTKKFRVVMGSLVKVLNKAQTRRRGLTGRMDSQEGAVWRSWAMTLRVHETEGVSGYGDLADLEGLYLLNNPGSIPSSTITFTDHLNISYTVSLVGNLNEENLTPYLDGSDAAFLINIAMEESL